MAVYDSLKRIIKTNNDMKKQSKNQQIRNYLESGKSITALEALDLFGCFRLASRMNYLKNMGVKFKSEPFYTKGGAKIAKYSLI